MICIFLSPSPIHHRSNPSCQCFFFFFFAPIGPISTRLLSCHLNYSPLSEHILVAHHISQSTTSIHHSVVRSIETPRKDLQRRMNQENCCGRVELANSSAYRCLMFLFISVNGEYTPLTKSFTNDKVRVPRTPHAREIQRITIGGGGSHSQFWRS